MVNTDKRPASTHRIIEAHCQLVRWCQSMQNFYYSRNFLNDLDTLLPIFDYISGSEHLEIHPLERAVHSLKREDPKKTRVSFRMDVDSGIWSAAALSRALKERNIPIHIFLLHTAEYYGKFDENNNFARHPGFIPFLEELKATRQEIGIHNDMLSVFAKGKDGISAFTTELEWLQRQGVQVSASVAHNSAWAYGAENFELFSEHSTPKYKPELNTNATIPFGVLNAKALGLKFEANHPLIIRANPKRISEYLKTTSADPIRDSKWLRAHFITNPIFHSAYDTDIWLVGHNLWFVACRKSGQIIFPLSHEGILQYLQWTKSRSIVFNLHPDYISEHNVFLRCGHKQMVYNNNIDLPHFLTPQKMDNKFQVKLPHNCTLYQDEPSSKSITEKKPHPIKGYALLGDFCSGTSSVCNFLNEASNGSCKTEPASELQREARVALAGHFPWRAPVLAHTVLAKARELAAQGTIHGEYNAHLTPFVSNLALDTSFRFIICTCDGREVVQSRIQGSKNQQEETTMAALLLPPPTDPYFVRWQSLSYLEKATWQWVYLHNLLFEQLKGIPEEQWFQVDCSTITPEILLKAAQFLSLKGLNADTLKEILHKKRQAQIGAPNSPSTKWEEDDLARFECIAAPTMQRLGYYEPAHIRFKPTHYGEWWNNHPGGLEWYTWMYDSRLSAHHDLQTFIEGKEIQGDEISSVLDVGCGLSVGYSEFFSKKHYVGYDIAPKNIQWCNANRDNILHSYLEGDFIKKQPHEKFDLVFSQGTIDNSYDMNAYLKAMVFASQKWIHVTAFRGWFPQLKEHRYTWDKHDTCFYNDISPHEVRSLLEELGCTEIEVKPLPMQGAFTHYETRITARVPQKSA